MKAETERLAEALGWVKCDRLGRKVWYDPEGGHVSPAELPAALNEALDKLIAEAGEPLPEDMAALAKLGNPFGHPSVGRVTPHTP